MNEKNSLVMCKTTISMRTIHSYTGVQTLFLLIPVPLTVSNIPDDCFPLNSGWEK